MTTQVLFVQGGGEGVHDEWDNKLVASLERELGAEYAVRYPRMPDEADPHYPRWKPALLEQLGALDDGAILVGHSLGGTMLLQALSEEPLGMTPGMIVLIAAPFIGEGGWPSDEIRPPEDLAERLPAGVPVFLFHGTADQTVPFAHVELHAAALSHPVVRELAGRDHQLNDDLTEVAREIVGAASRTSGGRTDRR